MSRSAAIVLLAREDREVLERWARGAKTEQRLALRGRAILAAASGTATGAIARREGIQAAMVSKWRSRFARRGLAGLQDERRPRAKRLYDEGTEQQSLDQLHDIGAVEDFAQFGSEGEERNHLLPNAPPALRDGGIFFCSGAAVSSRPKARNSGCGLMTELRNRICTCPCNQAICSKSLLNLRNRGEFSSSKRLFAPQPVSFGEKTNRC